MSDGGAPARVVPLPVAGPVSETFEWLPAETIVFYLASLPTARFISVERVFQFLSGCRRARGTDGVTYYGVRCYW